MQKVKQKSAQTGREDVVSKGPWPKPDVIEVSVSLKITFFMREKSMRAPKRWIVTRQKSTDGKNAIKST